MTSLALVLPGFYALSAAWLFLLVPPLVLLYFLKLKRPPREVPSLVLWRQVLQDHRVNSPFQKFRRNLLLLLQLLLLLALILGAMQPYWRGDPDRAAREPVLIDCSASMAATDAAGQTRLEAARERVRRLIDGLLPDQELCLVSFARTPRKLTGFTNNKRELHAALEQIEVQEVPSELDDALRLAQALVQTTPFDKVLLLTDGNLPSTSDLELPFTIDYQRLPPAAPNYGITALSARRASDTEWDVFAKVEASAKAGEAEAPASPATVELFVDDPPEGVDGSQPLGREHLTISPGGEHRLVFRVTVSQPLRLRVVLSPDLPDSLPSDNRAYIDLQPARPLRAYVAPSLAGYRQALRGVPGVTLLPERPDPAGEAACDLLITDTEADLAVPAATRFAVGVIPQDVRERQLVTVTPDGTTVVSWERGAPLLQHVDLNEVVILDQVRSGKDVDTADFESLGYEVLVDGQHGPLLLGKRQGARVSYFLLFNSDRSTLRYRIAFPVLIWNLAMGAMQQAGLLEKAAAKTGVLPPQDLTPPGLDHGERSYRVQGPHGIDVREQSGKSGLLTGVPAPYVGRYKIDEDGAERAHVGVSLLDPRESSLAAVEQIKFKEVTVAAAKAPGMVDKPLWPYLAAAGLLLLVVEWWAYQRRVGLGRSVRRG